MRPTTRNDLLEAARAATGWTQEDVAARVRAIIEAETGEVRHGFDQRKVSRLERGETRWPARDERAALRTLYGVAEDRDLGFYYRAPDSVEALPATMDDVNRRELLRLGTLVGAAAIRQDAATALGADPRNALQRPTGDMNEWQSTGTELWTMYASAPSKATVLPAVRAHVAELVDRLRAPMPPARRTRTYELTSNAFQLAGEILFDTNDYADAANCYAVASNAGREAGHYDLWACSMVRHAFISLYERQFAQAEPLLALASQIAARGDSSLSTRQWAGSVHAQALAGLGDATGCLRALDLAESVTDLRGDIHNGGWLRFDGSRLAEERGACLVELGKPIEAEKALTIALRQGLSDRRRVGVLVDMAKVGAQLHDPERVASYASAALDVAQRSQSGVNVQRLHSLKPYLKQVPSTAEVKTVRFRIDELKRKEAHER
ncbi:helix-turn-helix domain-containing protein [Catenulispora pinisilvae]|uniref:helix-turn-helix domain-containing protein n=1 Tax=Catenulispora pinisilvae TaxID=2705253 RepID=UPI001890C379|nr:helix-turn-helix transcriptional regulator [Catenulispora pinisilvae]